MTIFSNGNVTLKVDSIAGAKLGIKQLQLKKKEYAADKRLLATKVAEQQTARRMQTAQQGSKMRGGGKLGRAVRGMETITRDHQRLQHAAALAPLDQMKLELERKTIVVDKAIMQLQKFILDNSGNE